MSYSRLVGIVNARATFDKLGACARLLVTVIIPSTINATDKYDDKLGADDGPH